MSKSKESDKRDEKRQEPRAGAPVKTEEIAEDTGEGLEGAAPAEAEVGDVERLREQLGKANDQLLRSHAELENYRKRVRREMDEQRRYALLPLLRDLLPVVDNIDRAIAAAVAAEEAAGLLAGFQMVASQLHSVLTQHHCEMIEADGAQFDPHLHEAICQQPTPDEPENKVLQVTQVGYKLHDRVIRPSQVVVSTAPPQEEEE